MANASPNTRSQLYWNTLLKIPTQGIAFALSIIVARLLTPADFGILSVATMLIGYANLFTDFGLSSAIVQQQIHDDDTLRSVFTFNLVVSAILALAFALASGLIAEFFRSPESRAVTVVMSSIFVITSFSAVPRAVLRRDVDFKSLSLVDSASALTAGVVSLSLALAGFRYWSLAWGQLVPAVLFTVYLCFRTRWLPAIRFRLNSIRGLLNFGAWNLLRTQLDAALSQVDKVIVGRWSGMVALGYYDKAKSICSVSSDSLIASLSTVLFSSFSQRQDDRDDVRDLLKKGLTMYSVVSFPLYIGLALVANYFVIGLLGHKWQAMAAPLQVVSLSFAIGSIGGLLGNVDVAIGKYRAYTVRSVISGCVFLALCILLRKHGAMGVSIALLLRAVVSVALALELTVASTDVTWPEVWRGLRPAAVATAIMSAATWLLSHALPAPTIANLLLLSGAGAIAYALCLALVRDPSLVFLKEAISTDWARLIKSGKPGQ